MFVERDCGEPWGLLCVVGGCAVVPGGCYGDVCMGRLWKYVEMLQRCRGCCCEGLGSCGCWEVAMKA